MQAAALLFPATAPVASPADTAAVTAEGSDFAAFLEAGQDEAATPPTEPLDEQMAITEGEGETPTPSLPPPAFWPVALAISVPTPQTAEGQPSAPDDHAAEVVLPQIGITDTGNNSPRVNAEADVTALLPPEAPPVTPMPKTPEDVSDLPESDIAPLQDPDSQTLAAPARAASAIVPLAAPPADTEDVPAASGTASLSTLATAPVSAVAATIVEAEADAAEADPGAPVYWQLRVAQGASHPATKPETKVVDQADPAAPVGEAADPPLFAEAPALRSQATVPLTPSAPTQSPATGQSLPPAVPAQVAAIVSTRPDSPVELRLSPAELGHLRLHLTQEGEALRVTIQVERPETLDLLRRHADVLLNEIRSAGFSGGNLSFTGWGGDGQGSAGTDRPAEDRAAVPDSPRTPAATLAAPVQAMPQGVATGTLNLRL